MKNVLWLYYGNNKTKYKRQTPCDPDRDKKRMGG